LSAKSKAKGGKRQTATGSSLCKDMQYHNKKRKNQKGASLTTEATDAGITNYASKSPVFDFLNDPQEDIYSLEDGEQICH